MALSPAIARLLPARLRAFTETLRYPYVFLASIPAFILGMLLSRYIPYPEQVLTGLGLAMFISSKIRDSGQ